MADSADKAKALAAAVRALQGVSPRDAVEILSAFAEAHPGDADVLHHWGSALLAEGDLAGAIDKLAEASRAAPDRADMANDLGVMLHRAGHLEDAKAALQRATALAPDNAQFHHSLGYLLIDLGDPVEAETAYRQAVTLDAVHASAHNNLGNLYKTQGRTADAAESYAAAIEADPDYAAAYKNLADLREWEGDWQTAAQLYERCAELRGDDGARIRAAMTLPVIPESLDEINGARARMAAALAAITPGASDIAAPLRDVGGTPFFTAYHGLDDRKLHTDLATKLLAACPTLAFEAPHCARGGAPKDKIRIGFVSAFFRDHTIAKLNRGLIAHLPRDDFEVHVFSFVEEDDAATNAIRQGVDFFTALPVNLEIARDAIARAELDILYYTDIGMDPATYFLAFSRLAPVQCTTWGHPDTTGIPNIDYFISSDLVETADADAAYSETLIRLAPFTTCVDLPRPPKSMSKEVFGLSDNTVHYVCPQSLFKFHPDFGEIIGGILRQDRRAELLLVHGTYWQWADRLRARFTKTIPDVADQIRFLPRLSSDKYLDLLAVADVVLDTPHFCGGMTTYEALACGAPVVTLPSEHTRGRLSLGLYRQMGMDDLIANDADDYVALATRLAADRPFNMSMRQRIADRVPALFDNRDAVDAHARFFRWAMENSGDAPPVF